MSPLRRAVTRVLRILGAACIFFSALEGGLAAYHLYGRKPGFPFNSVLSALVLLILGLVVLLRSSAFAARLTEEDEE